MGEDKLQYLNEVSELERAFDIVKKISNVGMSTKMY